MFTHQLKFLFLSGFLFLFGTSCQKDDGSELSETLVTTENYQGNKGGAKPPNGDPHHRSTKVVTDWIDLFLELDRYAEGMRPNATARALAYIHLAAYETAAPAFPEYESNSGHLPGFQLSGDDQLPKIEWPLALNSCYARVLDHFLINVSGGRKSKISELETDLNDQITTGLPAKLIQDSEDWGNSVADQIIAYSKTDEAAENQILDPQPVSYVPPVGDGFWTFSAEPERALFPFWKDVRTFIISPSQTSSVPPVAYSENQNSDYYRQMEEVYEANEQAKTSDHEALWIAEFWSDDVTGLTFSPPARHFSIIRQLIDQYHLDLPEALYLNLKMGLSLNDAAVCTWKYKYQYMVMRPSVYLQEFVDPDYATNLLRLIPWPNPTFPGYPSGHSCFASASAGVLIDFFGNQTNFTDRSHAGRTEFQSKPRNFKSFSEMADECGYSRIPLGVHMRMDCTEGLRLGYQISEAINKYHLEKPKA
ncbi:MAG: vanadium-dependent haloperoxidase [Saprospiraceae bacterium]|nr:vanadium-dependent haloperoxidase [Saprospiraceae bacterium]